MTIGKAKKLLPSVRDLVSRVGICLEQDVRQCVKANSRLPARGCRVRVVDVEGPQTPDAFGDVAA